MIDIMGQEILEMSEKIINTFGKSSVFIVGVNFIRIPHLWKKVSIVV